MFLEANNQYPVAKLQYNEIAPKKTVIMDGDPFLVLSSAISKKDRQKASNTVKMKNLRSGSVLERTFHQADVLEEAELETKEITYIYTGKGEYWFHSAGNPGDRFALPADSIGNEIRFVREKSDLPALIFNEEIIGVRIPVKVDLQVTEAAPAVKGNTSSGATKEVTLETGVVISVPMFINEGDIVRVNTETGEYAERAEKG